MAYLSADRPTITVKLPTDSNYWVKVKVGLTYGELKKFRQYGGTEPFSTAEKLKLSVVEWNLDDADGNILPIDDTSIDALQEDDVLAIAEAAMPKESENEKKNSPKASSATSAEQK